ncbi:unnamed protein product [Leuciscus chuanchicus]
MDTDQLRRGRAGGVFCQTVFSGSAFDVDIEPSQLNKVPAFLREPQVKGSLLCSTAIQPIAVICISTVYFKPPPSPTRPSGSDSDSIITPAHHLIVCDGSPEYPGAEAEEGVPPGMEHIQVRRRSSRTLQLPPLVFRQAEQHDWNSREMESIARPTTLALRIPPLIAITSADTGR